MTVAGDRHLTGMRPWLQSHKRDGIALAGLAALTLIFFWPVSLGLAHIPRGGGDLASFLWPVYSYAARSLWSGRVPLWNPTLYGGMPFLADNQTAVFYPVNHLAYLLTPAFPYRAIEWLVVFHFWLAGAGMYVLVRALLPGAPYSALLAAIAYMFSEVFVTHIGNLNIVAVAAWLPWALAALHQACERRSLNWALVAGIVLGVAALAGHAQMWLMVAGTLAAYTLFQMARAVLNREPRAAVQVAGLALAAALTALGLSALTLLPALELIPHTARARLTYAAAAEYSLPWAGLAGLFSPLVFGRGAVDFWGPWARVELGYAGVLPLLLAGLAPLRNRGGLPLFMLLLAAGGLLIALGENTPVHGLLYRVVPGFAQLRVPARFVLLTDFGLAVLAGYGLHSLGAISQRRVFAWAAVLGVMMAGVMWASQGWAASRLGQGRPEIFTPGLTIAFGLLAGGGLLAAWPGRYTALAAGAILAADLIGHGAWVEVEWADPTRGFQHPAVIAYLRDQPGPTRIDAATGLWAADAAAVHGFEDIGGVSNPLGLAAYQNYAGALGPRGSSRYDFLGAQWIVAARDQPPSDDPDIVPVFNEDPQVEVWLNTAAMPRATLVYAATHVASGEAAFSAILAPGFDPRHTVILQGDAPRAPEAYEPGTDSNLYYLDYAPEAFTLIAHTSSPAWLVLSEVWYPGWQAWVNGEPQPVLAANYAFRAVRLPGPGEHRVEMRFDPLSWRAGLMITIAALLIVGLRSVSWLRSYRRKVVTRRGASLQ